MTRIIHKSIAFAFIALLLWGCNIPRIATKSENRSVPAAYGELHDSTNTANINWKQFFTDKNLVNLIDSGLIHNQELMINLQEIQIAKNDILFRQGPLKPVVGAKIGGGVEKVGRYTSQGAGDATTEIYPGKEMPDPLTDITATVYANWEVDIWKKLHNSKKAAVTRYLSTIEGRNFVLTNLIAEIANSYYELVALDNQLEIVKQNIELQKNALEIIKVQKRSSKSNRISGKKIRGRGIKIPES